MNVLTAPPAVARRSVRGLLAVGWSVVVVGAAGTWVHVETVLVSGPVLAAVALLTLVAARRSAGRAPRWLAVAHLAVVTLFVSLVNALRWAPSDATVPFGLMSTGYLAAISWPTWRAWRSAAADLHVPGVCDDCGYQLRGLIEPRCPECGRRFDAEELSATAPS